MQLKDSEIDHEISAEQNFDQSYEFAQTVP